MHLPDPVPWFYLVIKQEKPLLLYIIQLAAPAQNNACANGNND